MPAGLPVRPMCVRRRGQPICTTQARRERIEHMDPEDIERAATSLAKILAAIEAGELEAPRRVVDQLRGAVAALGALSLAAGEHLR